jgi:hypothetical protein
MAKPHSLDLHEHVPAALAAGDIIVMDNLGSHKSLPVRAAGASPSSCRPATQTSIRSSARLKALRRKAEERTGEGLWKRIGARINALAPAECVSRVRLSAYASA